MLSSLDKDREDTLLSVQDLLEEGGDSSPLHSPSRIEKKGETIEDRKDKTSVRAYQLVHVKGSRRSSSVKSGKLQIKD